MDNVEIIIHKLETEFNVNKICVLIIPGLNWKKNQIRRLKKWQNRGIEIGAHGWKHLASTNKSFYHKIHSIIISRNCAEHLSMNKQDIIKLMNNSYEWFINNGFKKPKLYVPPAWALGNVSKEELHQLKFKYFECTTGMIHNKKYKFLPLLGFEEKTFIGSKIRKIFNLFNFIMASFIGVIRIAIHPNDFKLYLKHDIKKYLSKNTNTILLHELT